jgi:epsilon-lactone hydrolase
MSLRLRALTLVMRLVLRPLLARTVQPAKARRDFNLLARLLCAPPFLLHRVDAGPPVLHWVRAGAIHPARIILYLHGGGYIAGNPAGYAALMGRLSRLTGLHVAAPVYRLAPEHPAPAAFDDAVFAHAALIARGYAPGDIVLGGDSAGGGLALALLAHLCACDQRPAGLFAMSAWTDLSLTGASLHSNAAVDPILPVAQMPDVVAMVRGDLAPDDPRLSPLFAAFDAPPPVFLQVGTTEILLDDTRRMADVLRRAGGQVEVSEWRCAPHVWHLADGYLPEARAALSQIAQFVAGLPYPLAEAVRR